MHAPKLLRLNISSFHRTLRFVFFQIVEFFVGPHPAIAITSDDCIVSGVLILRQRFVWIE
jgi:hypothetical protein